MPVQIHCLLLSLAKALKSLWVHQWVPREMGRCYLNIIQAVRQSASAPPGKQFSCEWCSWAAVISGSDVPALERSCSQPEPCPGCGALSATGAQHKELPWAKLGEGTSLGTKLVSLGMSCGAWSAQGRVSWQYSHPAAELTKAKPEGSHTVESWLFSFKPWAFPGEDEWESCLLHLNDWSLFTAGCCRNAWDDYCFLLI